MANTKKNRTKKKTAVSQKTTVNKKSITHKKSTSNKKQPTKSVKKDLHKRNILIITLIIVAIVIVGISTSFAFFTSTDEGEVQIFKTGTLTVVYEEGKNISDVVLAPVVNDNSAEEHHFTVTNDGTIAANYTLKFKNISLTKKNDENENVDVTSENLKWALYSATKTGTGEDVVYTKIGSIPIATGDFGTIPNSKELPIIAEAEGTTLPALDAKSEDNSTDNSDSYILKIWLQNTSELQNNDQGMSFSAQVEVYATQQ